MVTETPAAALTLVFQRGPWHVRVSETSYAQGAAFGGGNVAFGHWIELVFLVDMILETLDLMPGVEPRDPAATA